MNVHEPEEVGACGRPWGRGRWFGPLHLCNLLPYHQEPCRCRCGVSTHDRHPETYSWASVPHKGAEGGGS